MSNRRRDRAIHVASSTAPAAPPTMISRPWYPHTSCTTDAWARPGLRQHLDHALDDEPDARFGIHPKLDEATRREQDSVRHEIASVEQARQQARASYRDFIAALHSKGMTGTDIARVMQITRGRVSQLSRR